MGEVTQHASVVSRPDEIAAALNDARSVLAVHRRFHVEALQLEVNRDQPPDHLVVVHDEHPSQSVRHARESSAF